MKRLLAAWVLTALVAGCAASPDGGTDARAATAPDTIHNDPGQPGAGAQIGIGAGRWGGRSGGGIGIGIGF